MNSKFDFDFQCLIKLIELLKKNNIKYWLDFGTLLGFYRDQTFLDHDNDIDLCVLCDGDINNFLIRLKNILEQEFKIREIIGKNYINILPTEGKLSFQWLDIYIYKKLGKKCFCPCINCDFSYFYIYNLEKLMVNNYEFNIPFNIEEFLKLRYGINFKTEIKSTHYSYNLGKQKETTVYATGVFDLFHIGHVNYLKKAKELFDKVIVGVHNDKDVASYKRMTVIPYEQRVEVVKSCKFVDEIFKNAPIYTTDEVLDFVDADYTIVGRENLDFVEKLYPLKNKNKLFLVDRTLGVSTKNIIEKIKLNIL